MHARLLLARQGRVVGHLLGYLAEAHDAAVVVVVVAADETRWIDYVDAAAVALTGVIDDHLDASIEWIVSAGDRRWRFLDLSLRVASLV